MAVMSGMSGLSGEVQRNNFHELYLLISSFPLLAPEEDILRCTSANRIEIENMRAWECHIRACFRGLITNIK